MFMLTPLALVGILLAHILAGVVGWWFAVPLALGLTIGLFALVHMSQGGGAKFAELGCSAWILAAVLLFVPGVLGMIGKQRDSLVCRDNLRRIGVAMKLYASANDGLYPPFSADWQAAIRPLLPPAENRYGKDAFVCPSAGGRASYFYRTPKSRPKGNNVLVEEPPFALAPRHRMAGKSANFVLFVSGQIRRER